MFALPCKYGFDPSRLQSTRSRTPLRLLFDETVDCAILQCVIPLFTRKVNRRGKIHHYTHDGLNVALLDNAWKRNPHLCAARINGAWVHNTRGSGTATRHHGQCDGLFFVLYAILCYRWSVTPSHNDNCGRFSSADPQRRSSPMALSVPATKNMPGSVDISGMRNGIHALITSNLSTRSAFILKSFEGKVRTFGRITVSHVATD
jgi:hypothetical protein